MRAAPIGCPEESPMLVSVRGNFVVRTRNAVFMGFSLTSVSEGFQRASGKPFGAPTGVYPLPWVGPDAPTPAREQGLQPYGALDCFEWRSEGDWGRAESPQCARRRIPLPPAGPDAPTAAREWDLQSQGAFILFFRWRKKSMQKKASGTALRKKGSYCPF